MELHGRFTRWLLPCATAVAAALHPACAEPEDLGRGGYELVAVDVGPDRVRIDTRFGPAVTPAGASMLGMGAAARAAVERGFEYFAVRAAESDGSHMVLDLYHEPPDGWRVVRADAGMDSLLPARDSRDRTVMHAASFVAACEDLGISTSRRRIDTEPEPQVADPDAGGLRGAPFLSCPDVDQVRSIALLPGRDGSPARLCVAGRTGAMIADVGGAIGTRIRFGQRVGRVVPLDTDGDGVEEFVNRGGGWQAVSVLEHDGSVRWTFPDEGSGGSGSPDMLAAGDLDGDGSMEYVVGMNAGAGVYLLDARGKVRDHWAGTNVFSVALVDVDGDGALDIVHTDGSARPPIVVRDAHGDEIGGLDPGFSSFDVFETPDGEIRFAQIVDGQVVLADAAGRVVARHPVAPAGHKSVDVVWARMDGTDRFYTAVARTIGASSGHSEFYVFDPDGALVHHEELSSAYTALGVLPAGADGRETLLVGSGTDVRRYDLAP